MPCAFLYSYSLPTRSGALLQLEDRYGEIAPLEGLASAIDEAKELLPRLAKGEPVEAHNPSVRFAIDCLSRPLVPFDVPIAALLTSPDQPIPAGFPAYKLKVKHLTFELAADWCWRVHRKYPNASIRCDANRSWSLDDALRFRPPPLEYFEEPCRDLDAFAKRSSLPVAVDETYTPDTPYKIVFKPSVHGPLPNRRVILSGAYESGIGSWHIAQMGTQDLPIGLDTYRIHTVDLLETPLHLPPGRIVSSKVRIQHHLLCLLASA